jgi:hypothetical protein
MPDDTSLPELELIIGCVVALPRVLWQLKGTATIDASLSLLEHEMLGVCAPATCGNATRWRCSRAACSRCSSPTTATTTHRCLARLCAAASAVCA